MIAPLRLGRWNCLSRSFKPVLNTLPAAPPANRPPNPLLLSRSPSPPALVSPDAVDAPGAGPGEPTEKPNIRRFAREIEGECGKKESIEKYLKRIESTEKRLKRMKRDPRILEYVEDRSIEWSSYSVDGKITDPFRRLAKRLAALLYLSKIDPPDEE